MKTIYHRGGIALGGGDNVHKATAQITLAGVVSMLSVSLFDRWSLAMVLDQTTLPI
jgi:hypothetical protein